MTGDIVERHPTQVPGNCPCCGASPTLIESLRSDNAAMRDCLIGVENCTSIGAAILRAKRALSRIQERG